MSDQINEHSFDITLPMYPPATVSDLKMDGKNLKGVTDLTIRAGGNGFTNVVMEFEAAVAVEFVGHLVAHVQGAENEEMTFELAQIYRDARNQVENELEGEGLEYSHLGQARLVQRIIETAMERIK
jgi:hypothetical protein